MSKNIPWRLAPYDCKPDVKAITLYFDGSPEAWVRQIEALPELIDALQRCHNYFMALGDTQFLHMTARALQKIDRIP